MQCSALCPSMFTVKMLTLTLSKHVDSKECSRIVFCTRIYNRIKIVIIIALVAMACCRLSYQFCVGLEKSSTF